MLIMHYCLLLYLYFVFCIVDLRRHIYKPFHTNPPPPPIIGYYIVHFYILVHDIDINILSILSINI